MAFGTLKADTLTHSTAGSLATNYVVNGSAKAWSNYNQTGPTVDGSFSVSSISDDGTGDFTVNLTSAMINNDWAAGFISRQQHHQWSDDFLTTTSCSIITRDGNTNAADGQSNCLVCVGDLA
jgi:hypothetical protein